MKTSELTGAALDWAVAKCEGQHLLDPYENKWELCWVLLGDDSGNYYAPSTNWAQGGPIIEREGISVIEESDRTWTANIYRYTDLDIPLYSEQGRAPLTAAMRCYVASKLGDDIQIPEALK